MASSDFYSLADAQNEIDRLARELETANFFRDKLAERLAIVETAMVELEGALACNEDIDPAHWRDHARHAIESALRLCRRATVSIPKGRHEEALTEREYGRATLDEALYDAREYLVGGPENQAEWWEHLGDAHRDYAALAQLAITQADELAALRGGSDGRAGATAPPQRLSLVSTPRHGGQSELPRRAGEQPEPPSERPDGHSEAQWLIP